MAKGGFDAKWKGDKKFITIDLDDKHQIKITRPRTGDPDVINADGPFDKPPLDLNNLPPDTVILTHTNPTCGYYYFNRRWWYR